MEEVTKRLNDIAAEFMVEKDLKKRMELSREWYRTLNEVKFFTYKGRELKMDELLNDYCNNKKMLRKLYNDRWELLSEVPQASSSCLSGMPIGKGFATCSLERDVIRRVTLEKSINKDMLKLIEQIELVESVMKMLTDYEQDLIYLKFGVSIYEDNRSNKNTHEKIAEKMGKEINIIKTDIRKLRLKFNNFVKICKKK